MGDRNAESGILGCSASPGSAPALCPPCLSCLPPQPPHQRSRTAQSHPMSLQPSRALSGMCLCTWHRTWDCNPAPCARRPCASSVAPGRSLEWHGAAASELFCQIPSFSPKRLCGLTGLSCDVTQGTGSCCISPHSAGRAGQEMAGLSHLARLGSPKSCRVSVMCLEHVHGEGAGLIEM